MATVMPSCGVELVAEKLIEVESAKPSPSGVNGLFDTARLLIMGGWVSMDITSPRADRTNSLKLNIKLINKYQALAKILEENSSKIEGNLKSYNFLSNIDLLSDILFKVE